MKYEDAGLMKRSLGTRNAHPSLAKRNEEILKEITKILASPPFVLKAKIRRRFIGASGNEFSSRNFTYEMNL